MDNNEYKNSIIEHYESFWGKKAVIKNWHEGPISSLPKDFCVLEFAPDANRKTWTYSTCCMSNLGDKNPIELHIFSPLKTDIMVELLTIVAHFHKNGEALDLWHTVNFGRPWQNESYCSYALISLPYMDGPKLENFQINESTVVKFYWLLPITETERDYKIKNGVEALEKKFEEAKLDCTDINRKGVV